MTPPPLRLLAFVVLRATRKNKKNDVAINPPARAGKHAKKKNELQKVILPTTCFFDKACGILHSIFTHNGPKQAKHQNFSEQKNAKHIKWQTLYLYVDFLICCPFLNFTFVRKTQGVHCCVQEKKNIHELHATIRLGIIVAKLEPWGCLRWQTVDKKNG